MVGPRRDPDRAGFTVYHRGRHRGLLRRSLRRATERDTHRPLAEWEVDGPERWLSDAAKIAYCTSRRNAFELLQTALRGASPVVYDEVIDPRTRAKRRVRNADETEQAELKAAAIAERFSLWVWENAERETRIVTSYNETMNSRVKRKHDGSYLSFPGLAEGVEPWPWQRDFVDMAISTLAPWQLTR